MTSSRAVHWGGGILLAASAVFLADSVIPGPMFGWMGAPDPVMAPNSAFGFGLAGGAIVALARRTPRGHFVAGILAMLLAGCALSRILLGSAGGSEPMREYFLGAQAHAPGFALTDVTSIGAVNFLLTAVALGLLAWPGRIRSGDTLAALLAVAIGISGQAFVGRFVLGAQPQTAVFWTSLVRSLLFAVLALGIFHLAVTESWVAAERENPTGGWPYLNVEHGVSAAFGVTLGIVALGGLLSYNLVARFIEDGRRAGVNQQLVIALNDLHTTLGDAEAAARGYVASGDPAALHDYFEAVVRIEPLLHTATDLSARTGRAAALAHCAPVIEAALDHLQEAVAAYREERSEAAGRALVALGTARLDEQVADGIRLIEDEARGELAEEAAHREAGRARTLVAFSICACCVGLIVVLLHRRFEADLEARRRAEATLRRHNETLKSFAHTVAHDLRAPLRGISGYARELGAHAPALDERGRFCVSQIDAAARQLDRLIEGTLDYTRFDSATPELTTVDLPALVTRLLQQRAPQIQEYRTEIVTQFGAMRIQSWDHGVAQLLGNLFDNALKYSRASRPPRVHIETMDTPTAWRLTVRDNGIGFDMKHHDRIFGLFQRLPSSGEYEGTGAGLAIVRKIVERLGGVVWAESTPGAGAVFIVELPKTPAAALA